MFHSIVVAEKIVYCNFVYPIYCTKILFYAVRGSFYLIILKLGGVLLCGLWPVFCKGTIPTFVARPCSEGREELFHIQIVTFRQHTIVFILESPPSIHSSF